VCEHFAPRPERRITGGPNDAGEGLAHGLVQPDAICALWTLVFGLRRIHIEEDGEDVLTRTIYQIVELFDIDHKPHLNRSSGRYRHYRHWPASRVNRFRRSFRP
jgi:hypothetical protein